MPASEGSSNACGRSRNSADGSTVAWAPSRWLLAALLLLTALAPVAILASEMPRLAAWPLALLACAYGLSVVRREANRPARTLHFPANGRVEVDGQGVDDFALQWRGPLAFARWRDADGRVERIAWWPDTLPPVARRELRLAAPATHTARRAPSMAP
ncbi:hypothetical protein [Luteimonas yindakuii]|uniref:hypothetical protein n=1 Tax=Luteimonas yindakuii TaxID=2565782 RepID=UPI001AA08111|nr:hypothetical protein [Luteimonas yindakuii]